MSDRAIDVQGIFLHRLLTQQGQSVTRERGQLLRSAGEHGTTADPE